ncbi:hypothetical protein K60_009030 [Mycobacterium tuberculosis variant bovis BCG str. Korea 1168P]|uniref:Uncharacterized protein n=2 Tax=Mycobacterium tuberculosis TaxID=1773 RepID=Q8VKC8_MYCTO|nr:hypothetical protein MT0868 [Mycobacterium tuberculosis CDC1551]AGE66813.1 hypothetical protein K60_009030 [Mycobacterium tuberculosis variant bovis BCG str. Korea 1168P]AGL26329.1 hypothetical protein J113_05910 [Mycobacterium tuberculosis CAS/NITR204]AGL99320.1 hypothetical protein CFBS_0888 [Mycobacterium tuberculosis CCDC5079]AHJ41534.1 hypothetical protein HKBS1_0888 [Mycobacterium tuberculosis HKBS1]AHJ45686.1 hypothetical protein HKBT2_0889 [Mycobacterium tuberculosis BT2]AHJ49834.1
MAGTGGTIDPARLSTCAGVTSLPPAHRLTGNNGHSPFQW